MLLAAGTISHSATIEELREQVAAKQAEWMKAKNSLTLLQGFSAGYTTRSQRLTTDRQQLETVRQKIVTIQQNNLIKVTLQLGAETAKTMKDACDVGQAASTGVRALAQELLSNTLKDEAKKSLGLDTETLTSPITTRITGLNAIATKKVPEIEAVQKLLGSDLHSIRGQEWQDRAADPNFDMTQPGNDPRYWSDNAAILIKLEKVKTALDVAKAALQDISDELDDTNLDTNGKLPDATAQELQLRNELAFLQFALNDAINAEIIAARDAAAQALIDQLPDTTPEPPPYVAPKGEEETPEQYQQRRIQTIVNSVNAGVAPLKDLIDAKVQEYNALRADYNALTELWGPGATEEMNHLGWLQTYASVVKTESERDLSEFPTPALVANAYRDLKQFLTELNRRLGAPAAASVILSQMQDSWQSANELRVEVSDWVAMAAAQGVVMSFYGYDTPIEGTDVEGLIASLDDFNGWLPDARQAGTSRLAELSTRFNALNNALLQDISAAGSRFQQSEVALAQLFAAATASDQFLDQSGWSRTLDVMPSETTGTSGYDFWCSTGHVYRKLTQRAFWMRPFTGELMQALALPGEQGVIAFQQVLNRYGSFLAGFTTVNDQFHAKYVALRQAMEQISGGGYADTPPGLSVILAARGITPDLTPPTSIPFAGGDLGSESSSIDIGDRITELNAAIASHWGIGTNQWLEDPSLDVPGFPFDTHNPASILLGIKSKALREIPTWTKLYFTEWKAHRDAWLAELDNWHRLFFQISPFNNLYGIDAAWRAQYLQPAEDQTKADADAILARYVPIYDPPVIDSMTPDNTPQKLFPDSEAVKLQVYTLSMGVSFQWYRSLNGSAYTSISKANLPWYNAPYAEGVQNFYCRVWNTSGSCLSDIRTVIGIRKPRMIKQPTPASISARTGATVVLACELDETPAGGTKISQWFKAKLDAAGKPIIIHSPWGDLLYDSEPLNTNPRVSGHLTTTLTITDFQPEDAGAYFVHVSNEYNFCQSAIARVKHVTTDVAPVFLRQPLNQDVLPGGSTVFSVLVNGSPSPQYQWRRNGMALVNAAGISGANTPALTLDSLQSAQSGSITCTVTCGSKKGTSATALLTVKAPAAPLIAAAPKAVTADPGAVVSFNVVAKGGFPMPYTYQWQYKSADTWSDLAGLTAPTITLVGISTDDAGEYRCVVGNGATAENYRSVTSASAALTLNGLPTITTDPADFTAQYGAKATFSAVAAGIPAPTLQWYRIVDGGEPVVLTGQTRSSLSLTLTGEPWASGTSFHFFLRAKNRFGSADSSLAELTVEDPFDSPASVGRYFGLVGTSATLNDDLGGSIDLTLNRVGSFTGRFNLAGKVYGFKGACDEAGTVDVTVVRKGLPSLIARLTFSGTGGLAGQLWQVGDHLPQDIIAAHQLPWNTKTNPATAFKGRYTAALAPPADAPADGPLGIGYLTFQISTAGACTGSGKLADGTIVTLSSSIWPDGSVPFFNSLYSHAGSILGTLDCAASPASGTLRWRKKPATPPSGRSYPLGIGPTNLVMNGGRYTPPAATHYLMDLTATQAGGLSLVAEEGGLTTPANFPFTLSTRHVATFNISTRDFSPRLTFNPTAGTMSGSFYVLDTQTIGGKSVTIRRTATVAGVLLCKSGTAPAAMVGCFLLPGLTPSVTTSPILSGAVEVTIP